MVVKEEHKLALYADDLMVFLTNINKSLPSLMKERKYSSFLGYKLNIQKTEAMIKKENYVELKRKCNFKWEFNHLKYFVIMIPIFVIL